MRNHMVMVPSQFEAGAAAIACSRAGGCTRIPGALGHWFDESRRLHTDNITILLVFESGTEARDAIARYLFERGEKAVCYVTDGIPCILESVQYAEAA